jgi:hypothetical protein
VSYNYKQTECNKFTHQYEIQYEKIGVFRHGENNPHNICAIAQILLSVKLDELVNVNTYAIIVNKLGKIEINKLKMETMIEENTIDNVFNLYMGRADQYLHILNYRDFRGFLIEIESDKKEEPIKGQITLSYNEYSFCTEIRKQLTQYNSLIFNLEEIKID